MKRVLIFVIGIVLIASCKKNAEHGIANDYPVLITQPVVEIKGVGATITASIKQHGIKIMVLRIANIG